MNAKLRSLVALVICYVPLACGPSFVWAKGDDLDGQVAALVQAKCVQCHDVLGSAAGGGVDNLLRLDELASGYLDAADPPNSPLHLLTLSDNPEMPKRKYKDVEWAGALSDEEKASLKNWIARGGPSEAYLSAGAEREIATIDDRRIVELIAADLAKLSGAALANARYLTLCNLYNNAKVTADELELYRAGVVKTLNSLSRVSDVLGLDASKATNRLVAVDGERTIFRFDQRHVGWSSGEWDRVTSHYPYALLQRRGAGKAIYSATSSELPYLRADWFVFATLQPPLYHDLVGVPKTLAELERKLGVDRLKAIRDRAVARAGMEQSKVSVNNRLLERIPLGSRSGAYHLSYDFAGNDSRKNLFDNPLGPTGAFQTEHAFEHDGGEAIFNLPNGFQAYALVKANGERIDTGPQNIVQDASMPGSLIINGISCLSCHYQGIKPEANDKRLAALDEVREHALGDFRRFTELEREWIAELHPEHGEFQSLLEGDRRRFLTALEAAGIPQNGADEPARALFDRFVKDLDASAVAAEFGLAPAEFKEVMQRESETRQLLARIERGTLKRQLYLTAFEQIARLTGAGETRPFKTLPFPYFGQDAAAADGGAAAPGEGRWRTGVDLIDADHRTGELKVQMWTADEKRSYREDEPIACRIRASDDCHLTMVAIDPAGEVTLLLPNRWHPEAKIKGGQTLTFPHKGADFEFYATPPHGETVLKAIVTRSPLSLKGVDRETLASKGLIRLGRVKALGVRQRTGDVDPPPAGGNEGRVVQFSERSLENTYNASDWGAASWTIATHPR